MEHEHSSTPSVAVADPSLTTQPFALNPVVNSGAEILAQLKVHLESLPESQVIAPWLKQLHVVKVPQSRVVVGVVGATGSGKSSVINALVGEKQLIPTNCMRACTAVVTEISWNEEIGKPWRAVIEFISKSAWRQELELLLGDVDSGARDITDEESEAGIAFSKITAVYPFINKKNVSEANIDALMQRPEVNSYLGAEIMMDATNSDELHDNIKRYIDSKEKLGDKFAAAGMLGSEEMDCIEYWPLINRVRIFGRTHVLSTGCMLVDLPGIADSNSARAAVAKHYLKKCAALWVVAPIIRAVDDKSARYLLGEAFKRQLHRDGTLSRITFICSKTDEIVIREARSVLDYDQDFIHAISEVDVAKGQVQKDRDGMTQALSQVRRDLFDLTEQHAKLYKEEQAYRHLKNLAASGAAVYPPILLEAPRKRALNTAKAPQTPKKASRLDLYMSKASQASPGKSEALSAAIESTANKDVLSFKQDTSKPSMSLSQVITKIEELFRARAALKDTKATTTQKRDEYLKELEELKLIEEELRVKEWLECVVGRNSYSANAIRADFAAGLQDLARDDLQTEEDVDDEDDIVADAQLAQGLPVFCVSSQGYQKLRGWLDGEQSAASFSEMTETGVPALQTHAMELGKMQMLADQENFMNEATRLHTSLRLWSSGAEDTHVVGDDGGEASVAAESAVTELVKGLKQAAKLTSTTLHSVVNMRIFQILPNASFGACEKAVTTVERWGRPPTEAVDPGLRWNTFKAVARRNGVYANHRKSYNFGQDLLEPLMAKVDKNWVSVFTTTLKGRYSRAVQECGEMIEKFSQTFESVMESHGLSVNTKTMFEDQVVRFAKAMGGALKIARKTIESDQKDANRLFAEKVETYMKPIYSTCVQERGTGSYNRIKLAIRAYVDDHKDAMFAEAADAVRTELERMLVEVKDTLANEIERLCNDFTRDCAHLVSLRTRDFAILNVDVQQHIIEALNQATKDLNVLDISANEQHVLDPALLASAVPESVVDGDADMMDDADADMADNAMDFEEIPDVGSVYPDF